MPPIRSQSDLLQWESEIDEILGRLTLAQKVGQLHQIALPNPQDAEQIRAGKIGSVLYAASAFAGNERDAGVSREDTFRLQRIALDESDSGLPLLFARDVIHGHFTVFPIPLGQAAAWNPELVEKSQSIAAAEASSDGLHWAFSPVADIGREPRWGRVAEGYGEDPYLSGVLTSAAVRGFQTGSSPILACLKHFVGYGVAEGGRDYARGAIGPHELSEIYLPPFKRGIEAGAATVMAAFNELDGIPTTGNPALIRRLLKEEWGFQGVVVSDWDAIDELIRHGVAANRRDAARMAIEAGIDIDMVSGCYSEHLAELVESGDVDKALVDDAVRRVLRLKFAMDLFENPYRETVKPPASDSIKVAEQFAAESCVLLQNNNNLLPLKKPLSVLLTGPFAEAKYELWGTWSCDGDVSLTPSAAEILRSESELKLKVHQTPDSLVEAARHCDCVVVMIGEHPVRSGEAHSVADLGLPPGQLEILKLLRNARLPIVTVLFSGRPLALQEVTPLTDALLLAWHPGSGGAQAIADLLFGRKNPQGRLPSSFPYQTGQIPVHYSKHPTGRPQAPPASRYLDAPSEAQFPFGHGETYAEFEFTEPGIELTGQESWKITSVVSNSGNHPGVCHAQLYLRDPVASRSRPMRELRRFATTAKLAPGEKVTLSFEVSEFDLMFSTASGEWKYEPGEFQFFVGLDSTTENRASIEV